MSRLIDEGKLRAGGLSNFDVGLLERASASATSIRSSRPFSFIRRQSAADVIPWSAAHGTGVIVYSPMQSGSSPTLSAGNASSGWLPMTGAAATRNSRNRG